MPQPLLPFAFLLLANAAAAQRPTPTFEWQKRSATLEYGAVPLGKHTLEELPVGQTWRMGMNDASALVCTTPLLAGDTVVAPGAYRVQLRRTGENLCQMVAEGSSKALGSGEDFAVVGALGKAAKPSKKLVIEWAKHGAAVQGNQPAKVVLQFGDAEWQGEVTVVGSKTVTVGGWKLTVFSLPAERLAARDQRPVPVAVLSRKEDENWNLIVGKDEAKLVPWMAKPTEQHGFGAVVPPDDKLVTVGKVTTAEVKVAKPYAAAEHLASSLSKGELQVEIGFQQEALQITIPEPKAKAGK